MKPSQMDQKKIYFSTNNNETESKPYHFIINSKSPSISLEYDQGYENEVEYDKLPAIVRKIKDLQVKRQSCNLNSQSQNHTIG